MDRYTFRSKTLNTHRPRVDRFVAPREALPEMRRRMQWGARCEQPGHDILDTNNIRQKKYMNYLNEAFGLEPLNKKENKQSEHQKKCMQWPCIPRKKSYLLAADSVLDLPSYSSAEFPELIDWSDDILVAALGISYHKWSWRTQSRISPGIAQDLITSCKFDPRGELLLLGTDAECVEIHDNALSKWMNTIYCPCYELHHEFCSITAIDWSPTGKSFVMGCSRGMLCSVSRYYQIIGSRQVIRGATCMVRVSPDARYLAVAAVNRDAVLILYWPSLELCSSINSCRYIKALTWHPWRSALLGIGSVASNLHSRIAFWNAPTSKIEEFDLGNIPYSLDAMLFSHKTGELVLSLWNPERAESLSQSGSYLVVMSDPDTVVDQQGEVRSSLDRVRTMLFSPDGTTLATATADEDLIFWSFLPEDKIKKKDSRRFSALPVLLDEASYGTSLR